MRISRLTPALAAIVVIAVTVSLGNWQMRRAAEKQLLQDRIDAALAAEPVSVGAQRPLVAEQVGGRVIVRGRWLDQYTLFVDNRTVRGRAGVHMLTPIKIEGVDQTALVLRGWLPSDPANRSKPPSPPVTSNAVSIEARVEKDLQQALELARSAPPGPEDRLWQNASIASVSAWSGLSLAPVLLRQIGQDDADGLVRDWPTPGAGVDKHHAYALQWYALAVLTAGLWVALGFKRRLRP
jgi:cytochrome oxidase assembly protein ShyY1